MEEGVYVLCTVRMKKPLYESGCEAVVADVEISGAV